MSSKKTKVNIIPFIFVGGILIFASTGYYLAMQATPSIDNEKPILPTISEDVTPSPTQTEELSEVNPTEPKTAQVHADTIPPQVYILTPQNNSRISAGTVKIVANVTDNTKVDRVEFFIGPENTPIYTTSTPPYEYLWETGRYMNGRNIPIEVRAYDTAGNKNYQTISVDPVR